MSKAILNIGNIENIFIIIHELFVIFIICIENKNSASEGTRPQVDNH